ncbi:MAG: TIGR00153 family protein [Candidatus Hodarchaeaceae archaeon]|nr:TIGR00153 family protein [Candidatus Hodarchaeaceae archaeon]
MREVLATGFLPFAATKEKAAFDILKEHAASVLRVVKKFEGLVIALSERSSAKMGELASELDRLETEADGLRRKFECGLSKGAFLPVFRGDFSRLAERVDDVADMAQEAARAITWRGELFDALNKAEKKDAGARAIRKSLVELAKASVKTTQALKGSIDTFMANIDAAILKAREIDQFEHESDGIEEKLAKLVYRYEKLFDPTTVAQLKEVIEKIGAISNCAEDAGDIIMAISFTLRA